MYSFASANLYEFVSILNSPIVDIITGLLHVRVARASSGARYRNRLNIGVCEKGNVT